MKLVVLGATGGTGLKIVGQAIERGYSVTTFVRAPERLKAFDGRIGVIKGDLLNVSQLEMALRGHDAVLSAFGPRPDGEKIWPQFAMRLAEAMVHAGVRRVLALSVAFLFKDSIVPPAFILGRLFLPSVVKQASEMETELMKSGLDWTILRPPRLTDTARTGRYRVREGRLPTFGFSISRADVADFALQAIKDQTTVGKIIGICN